MSDDLVENIATNVENLKIVEMDEISDRKMILNALKSISERLRRLESEKRSCSVGEGGEVQEDEEESGIGYAISLVFVAVVLISFLFVVKDEVRSILTHSLAQLSLDLPISLTHSTSTHPTDQNMYLKTSIDIIQDNDLRNDIVPCRLQIQYGFLTLSLSLSLYRKHTLSLSLTHPHYSSPHTGTDPNTKPLVLLYFTSFLIIIGGVIFSYVSPSNDFPSSVWESWQFIAGGDHFELETVSERIVGLIMTIMGMMVFGFMISIIEDTMSDYMEGLREGKSRVVEKNHTLILGWADKAIPIIVEVALANESEGGGTVVVLSEKNKTELEEYIQEKELDLLGAYMSHSIQTYTNTHTLTEHRNKHCCS